MRGANRSQDQRRTEGTYVMQLRELKMAQLLPLTVTDTLGYVCG